MAGNVLEFHSKEASRSVLRTGSDRVVYTLRRYRAPVRQAEDEGVSAGSMLVKLGICAVACALVLLVNGRGQMNVYTGATQEESETQDLDESLGKLRFVELPGLLSVFASGETLALPIDCSAYEWMEADTLLCMVSAKNQAVATPEECTVKAVGKEEGYGNYVSLATRDDREWVYYGLAQIDVEEGQPLCAQDALGRIGRGDKLHLRLRQAGRPVDLRHEFGLQSGL